MYNFNLHPKINDLLKDSHSLDIAGSDNDFYTRVIASADTAYALFNEIYGDHPAADERFFDLIQLTVKAYTDRSNAHKERDRHKAMAGNWFLSNNITGMSLYVDRFCGDLKKLSGKLDYFMELGVNFLHLMPLFESPADESDGGYAVSDFRQVDTRFGSLDDLTALRQKMDDQDMYLMLDIVLNHTSSRHEWATKAKNGDPEYQAYYYMFDDRAIPDQFEQTLPQIFPEAAPGNFTWVPECSKWAMTVFHNYQWDLNYTNPRVFHAMLDNIFFYANLGVDVLRIDAPAFIWKQLGTLSMNLPQVHTLLRLVKQFIGVATPGMAILGEAIVAPQEIIKYFGEGMFKAHECDFAYNATQMALQWDMLATGDTRIMLSSQADLLKKPYGASWITYTRCHDDIGLGYDDQMIWNAGFNPWQHRKFLQEFYTGVFPGSTARGALFAVNPVNGDARLSGTLASLCGLESALEGNSEAEIALAIQRIMLMQAHSIFLGGIPMLFYGDEAGYTNDYSYLDDPARSYDNRWMHRPQIDWVKNNRRNKKGTVEERIFDGTKKLIAIRKQLTEVADHQNLEWIDMENRHLAAYIRAQNGAQLFAIFNFSGQAVYTPATRIPAVECFDYWTEKLLPTGEGNGFLMQPYQFLLLKPLV